MMTTTKKPLLTCFSPQSSEVKLCELEAYDPVKLKTLAFLHNLGVHLAHKEQPGPLGRQRGYGETRWKAADLPCC